MQTGVFNGLLEKKSDKLKNYFQLHCNYRGILERFAEFNQQLELDKDRVRVQGQYYNNIYLGKRIFGPARKQVFKSTIIGGVERRFEIIENQVNYIPFTHEASDSFLGKCRNQRIKCRDDTRIVLKCSKSEDCDFIHANKISGGPLFNTFIITQAPMQNTMMEFWRMVWQEQARSIFLLINFGENEERCFRFWPAENGNLPISGSGLKVRLVQKSPSCQVKNFKHYVVEIVDGTNSKLVVELFHGDMNNSDDMNTPLQLLRIARGSSSPVVVVDHLGISRSACLVASELCIMSLLKGPSYQHLVQRSVHYLRSFRPFSIETPMQYLFIHRVVREFTQEFVKLPKGFTEDYDRWLTSRSQRLFVDDRGAKIPAYRLLSPRIDPDLLPQIRSKERPESRREIHSHVGELPMPLEKPKVNVGMVLPKKYPRGKRY